MLVCIELDAQISLAYPYEKTLNCRHRTITCERDYFSQEHIAQKASN